MKAAGRSKVLTACALCVWVIAVAFGMSRMWLYDATPGTHAKIADWPVSAQALNPSIRLASGADTLVMLAHPRCPCTLASMENLARIMAVCHGRLNAIVVFYEPSSNSSPEWTDTRLVADARRIPGARVVLDPYGVIESKFDGHTSGQTLVYDPSGKLLFNGGLTNLRGVGGDSAGSDAVTAIALNEKTTVHETPVFGCSLQDGRQRIPSNTDTHV